MRRPSCWYILQSALLLAAASAAFAQPSAVPQPVYQLTQLPLRPLAISNSGWIAGATTDQHAAVWNPKAGLRRIPLPAEFTFSESTSINSHGGAAGTATTADSARRVAFAFRDNKLTILPGEQSRANAINEEGYVVGQSILPGTKSIGPVEWGERPAGFDICCAGSARAINAQGTVVGDTYDREGRYHAFMSGPQGPRLLTASGEQYSSALAINTRGNVLIKATPGGLFLYSSGNMQAIEMPKASPRAMNNDDVVVGSFGPNPDAQRAFVWDKVHGLRDLNSLIAPGSGWTLEVATSINDRGEIVGWGDHNGVENAGFVLRLQNQRESRKR